MSSGRIKTAMRAKDTVALEALRAIKSEILLVKQLRFERRNHQDDEVKLLND
jgi:uncharacterized protein YqeY